MVKISIIIPTYNSFNFIIPCLDSILRQQAKDIEIILIDNASKDNTIPLVKDNYSKIKIIENKVNLGASRARNQGLVVANGEWILTLDCDVVLEDDFFSKVLRTLEIISPRVGSIQPKVLDIGRDRIYSAGIRSSLLKRFHDIGKGCNPDAEMYNVSGYIFGACCAAAFYRRKMLDQIKDSYGFFDERFFFLFEDVDLSWRIQKKGWFCLYSPDLKCLHHGNSSFMGKNSRQYLSFLNRLRTILKNQHPLITLLMIPLYLVYDLPRFLILAIKFKFKFPRF